MSRVGRGGGEAGWGGVVVDGHNATLTGECMQHHVRWLITLYTNV